MHHDDDDDDDEYNNTNRNASDSKVTDWVAGWTKGGFESRHPKFWGNQNLLPIKYRECFPIG
jgi:hypothetical protein